MTPLEKLIGMSNGRFVKKDGLIYDRAKDCYMDTAQFFMGSINETGWVSAKEIAKPYSKILNETVKKYQREGSNK